MPPCAGFFSGTLAVSLCWVLQPLFALHFSCWSVTHSANKRLLMGQALTALSRSLHQGAHLMLVRFYPSLVFRTNTHLWCSVLTHMSGVSAEDQECSHVESVGCAAHDAWLRFNIMLHCIIEYIYIALHYITLHCIALHYIALHCIALHYMTLHYWAGTVWSSSAAATWRARLRRQPG